MIMASQKGRSWKLERAGVNRGSSGRSKSNKYSKSDSKLRPAPHSREKVWVGGYKRADGTKVAGHFRATNV
jgi:hypothetical protein